jgi:hypothetical protein
MASSSYAPRRSPTAWLYLVAFLLPFAGCAASVAMGFSTYDGIKARLATLPRTRTPGEAKVSLERGPLELFYETHGKDDGSAFETSMHGGDRKEAPVKCTLHDPTGAEVALHAPYGHTTYHAAGRAGVSIYATDIRYAGEHRVTCTRTDKAGADATAGDQLVFVGGSLFRSVLMVFLPAVAGVLGGITLAIAVFFMRRRSVA